MKPYWLIGTDGPSLGAGAQDPGVMPPLEFIAAGV